MTFFGVRVETVDIEKERGDAWTNGRNVNDVVKRGLRFAIVEQRKELLFLQRRGWGILPFI